MLNNGMKVFVQLDKMQNYVVYINVFFDEGNKAANVESISVDEEWHVKLHHKGNPMPLPEWFCKLCKYAWKFSFTYA